MVVGRLGHRSETSRALNIPLESQHSLFWSENHLSKAECDLNPAEEHGMWSEDVLAVGQRHLAH